MNYTAACPLCYIEDLYVQLLKAQKCFNITAIVRTFSNMLNLNPSSGCLPNICDNSTAIEKVTGTDHYGR